MKTFLSWLVILLFLLVGCSSPSTPSQTPTQLQETKLTPTTVPTRTTSTIDFSTLPIISLENVGDLKIVNSFLGHTGFVGVLFSPDGKILASFGAGDKTIRLWDLTTGFEFASFQHPSDIQAIVFSPDGSKIASGGTDKTVRIWDVETGAEQTVYEGHTAGIGFRSLDWSPDGKFIAAGSRNDAIRIWETDSDSEYAVLHGHYDEILGISFSPDGTLLASASEDDTIRLWEVSTKSEQVVLSGHGSDVWDVTFNSDGSILASISGDITEKDITLRYWDVTTGEQLISIDSHDKTWLGEVSFSPDGSLLATCGGPNSDGTIHIHNGKTGNLIAVLEGSEEGILGISFSPDGRLIAAGSNGVIQLWGVDK